jgi:uncharacterized membrane protein YedE/YeeE
LIGGVLIGLSASLLLVGFGHIAGISGVVAGALRVRGGDFAWRVLFLAGLIGGGFVLGFFVPDRFPAHVGASAPQLVVAGLLVGFGTRLGSGCTSGHGVCGIGRLSKRSLVATAIFMSTGAVTVFVLRHVIGGAG